MGARLRPSFGLTVFGRCLESVPRAFRRRNQTVRPEDDVFEDVLRSGITPAASGNAENAVLQKILV